MFCKSSSFPCSNHDTSLLKQAGTPMPEEQKRSVRSAASLSVSRRNFATRRNRSVVQLESLP